MDSAYKALIIREWLDYDIDSADMETYLKLYPSFTGIAKKSVVVELP